MRDQGLIRPAPALPADGSVETVVLVPYQPLWRRVRARSAGGRRRPLRTIPVDHVRIGARLWVGPVVGAPAAAILVEGLVASGVRKLIVLGICGSLRETARIGDLILVEAAHSAEGTSRHYIPDRAIFPAEPAMLAALRQRLDAAGWPYQQGALVSTDAPYRETPAWIAQWQAAGALGVDMEMAAVYALGVFRGVSVAGLTMVSDELFAGVWRPGFRTTAFRRRCDQVVAEWLRPQD